MGEALHELCDTALLCHQAEQLLTRTYEVCRCNVVVVIVVVVVVCSLSWPEVM
jgi:hypothetical protein